MSTTTPAHASARKPSSEADSLRSRLRDLMPADRHRLRRRIDGLAGQAWLYTPRRIDEASSRGAEAS